MTTALVVGGGLFGRVIAKALHSRLGAAVTILDDNRAGRGSKPAACLMKPSWFSAMPDHEQALALLGDMYNIQDLKFRLDPTPVKTTVHWINPREILDDGDYANSIATRVSAVREKIVTTDAGDEWTADIIILACGVWAGELCAAARGLVEPRAGAAFSWASAHIDEPFIQVWAPFKQIVAFNRGDGLWCGDGTALKTTRLPQERVAQSHERCERALLTRATRRDGLRVLEGIRPYYTGREAPCLVHEVTPNVWLATGGAKNGTIGAAWAANRILRRYV